jgi:hypothetical protein
LPCAMGRTPWLYGLHAGRKKRAVPRREALITLRVDVAPSKRILARLWP